MYEDLLGPRPDKKPKEPKKKVNLKEVEEEAKVEDETPCATSDEDDPWDDVDDLELDLEDLDDCDGDCDNCDLDSDQCLGDDDDNPGCLDRGYNCVR